MLKTMLVDETPSKNEQEGMFFLFFLTYKVVMKTMKYVIAAPSTVLSFRNAKGKNWTLAKNLSQMAKPPRDTTPTTIMAMILPLAQEFPDDCTRLKGRRIRVKPAVIRRAPITGFRVLVSAERSTSTWLS